MPTTEMASGANKIPLGRLDLKTFAPSTVVRTKSMLKPEYSAGTSRFSDGPPPGTPPSAPPAVSEKRFHSTSRDHDDANDYAWVEKSRDSRSTRDRDGRYGNSSVHEADEYQYHLQSMKSSPAGASPAASGSREGSAEPAKKKKRSRWAEPTETRAFIPGMPTIIPANLSKGQERTYLLQLQIEDISRKLRTGDLGISANVEERSPSPEPIYNHEGKRLNTRDMRTRRRLEDDRHKLIQEMFENNPEYKPPPDYKAPAAKYTDKVLIPQDEHPEINFVGLLIGPRGNTLKSLEKDSGTKIIIRGKGSVKEGKIGRPNRDPLPGEDEPLHAYITGQTPETVRGAVERIKKILVEGIEVPEHQNDLRKQQLRELALLNGTLRDDLGPRCSNCGSTAHRTWNCPDKPNITHSVICSRCGGAGHIAKDCKTDITQAENVSSANMDDEYLSLMAELGHGTAPKPKPATSSAPVTVISHPISSSAPTYSAVPPPPPPGQPPGPPPQMHQQQHNSYNPSPYGGYPPPQQHMANPYGAWPQMQGPPPPPPPQQLQPPPHMMQQQQQHYGMYNPSYGMPPPPPPWGMPPPPPPADLHRTPVSVGPPPSMQMGPPPPPPPSAPMQHQGPPPVPPVSNGGYGAPYGGQHWASLPPPPPPPPM